MIGIKALQITSDITAGRVECDMIFLIEDVATRPTKCCSQGQHKAEHRHMLTVQTIFD